MDIRWTGDRYRYHSELSLFNSGPLYNARFFDVDLDSEEGNRIRLDLNLDPVTGPYRWLPSMILKKDVLPRHWADMWDWAQTLPSRLAKAFINAIEHERRVREHLLIYPHGGLGPLLAAYCRSKRSLGAIRQLSREQHGPLVALALANGRRLLSEFRQFDAGVFT